MATKSKPKPSPSIDDVYAEFDSLCGLIRHMAKTAGHGDEHDLHRCLYSIERLADRCHDNFFHALTGKPKGDVPEGGKS